MPASPPGLLIFLFSFPSLSLVASQARFQVKDSNDTGQDSALSIPGVIACLHLSIYLSPFFDRQDLLLGGLFPIHKQGEGGALCGDIQDEDGDDHEYDDYDNDDIGDDYDDDDDDYVDDDDDDEISGIQPLEALLFTVDEINSNSKLLPNITLGLVVW